MAGTGTLNVTPDTGTGTVTINTLPPSGQSTGANSLPVVLASDQPKIPVAQPDALATGTIASATTNATYAVALANGEGVVGFNVSGLTASGAILTVEAANNSGTFAPINAVFPATGALSTTVAADGNFRVNAGGHTIVQLRVSTVGTGTVNVASVASSVSSLVMLSGVAQADTVIRSTSTDRGTILPVQATSASVGAAGTGNAVGDVLTLVGGTLTPANAAQNVAAGTAAQFTVSAVSSGAVTAVTLKTAGSYTALPAATAATTSSGSGTGATLTPVFVGLAIQVAAANTTRRGLEYQPQGGLAYVSGLAAATADQHSLKLPVDTEYETPPHRVGTGAISAIAGGSVPVPLYVREF